MLRCAHPAVAGAEHVVAGHVVPIGLPYLQVMSFVVVFTQPERELWPELELGTSSQSISYALACHTCRSYSSL